MISGGTFNTVTPNHTNSNDGVINLEAHGPRLHRPGTGRYDGHDHHERDRQPDRHQWRRDDDATVLRISAGNLILGSLNGEHGADTIALTGITSITINGRAGDDTITLDASMSTFSGYAG